MPRGAAPIVLVTALAAAGAVAGETSLATLAAAAVLAVALARARGSSGAPAPPPAATELFLLLGFDEAAAEELARSEASAEDAARLLDVGCPHATAARILR